MRRAQWYVQEQQGSDGGAGGQKTVLADDKGGTVVSGGQGAGAAATAGDGKGADGGAGAAAGSGDAGKAFAWGDGWRQQIAGADEKELKILERFADPPTMWRSYRALQQRLSSGELKANVPFPEKGTDEDKAKWRTEAGIPDKPESYDLKWDDGFVIGEAEKPMVDAFLKTAHAKNLSPAMVKESVRWYFDSQEARVKELTETEAKYRQESEDVLRTEWGQDFRPNIDSVKALIGMAPKELQEQLMFARLADGKPLTSHPGALKFLAGLARQLNPVTTVIPGADGANLASSIDDELAKINKVMRENRKAYNADQKMQERYRELLAAQERLKAQQK